MAAFLASSLACQLAAQSSLGTLSSTFSQTGTTLKLGGATFLTPVAVEVSLIFLIKAVPSLRIAVTSLWLAAWVTTPSRAHACCDAMPPALTSS